MMAKNWKIITCRPIGGPFKVGDHIARHGAIPDLLSRKFFMEEGLEDDDLEYLASLNTGWSAFYATRFYIFDQEISNKITDCSKQLGYSICFSRVRVTSAIDFRRVDLSALSNKYGRLKSDQKLFIELAKIAAQRPTENDKFYVWDLPNAENYCNSLLPEEQFEIEYPIYGHDGEEEEVEATIPREWLRQRAFFQTYKSLWLREDFFLSVEGARLFSNEHWCTCSVSTS